MPFLDRFGLPGIPAPARIGLCIENADGVDADMAGEDIMESGVLDRWSWMADDMTDDSRSLEGILVYELV